MRKQRTSVIFYKMDRVKEVYKVTIAGSIINVVLLVLKFAAGILGHSAAMIADAIHSLTDFATDVVVLVFVKLGNKPMDKDHDYGHGKYETLATAIIGISLFVVGVMICYSGVTKTYRAICGETLQQPGVVALIAAIVSIVMKEWAYQFTVKAGRKYHSEAVVANAWHHHLGIRTDGQGYDKYSYYPGFEYDSPGHHPLFHPGGILEESECL